MIHGIEWIIIGVIAIIVLFGGAKKIPELARALGKALGEFKKGRREMDRELNEAKKEVKDVSNEIKPKKN